MGSIRLLLILLCAWGTSGCYVVSLFGITHAQSMVFDESLLGRWKNAEDETELVIERDEWKSYAITWHDRSGDQQFTGRLTTIANAQYLDATVRAGKDPGPTVLPIHIVGRIGHSEGALSIEVLRYEWFLERVGRASLGNLSAVVDERDVVVVTSPRARWRAWLGTHNVLPDLFEEPMRFVRMTEVSK